MANIEAKITSSGAWAKIKVVSITYGFAQTLEGGKWVNTTDEPQRFEDEILTLGKSFSTQSEAEAFMETKPFKTLLKTLQKSWVC